MAIRSTISASRASAVATLIQGEGSAVIKLSAYRLLPDRAPPRTSVSRMPLGAAASVKGSRASYELPDQFPFVSRGEEADDGTTIAGTGGAASRPRYDRIDKRPMATVKWRRSTVSHVRANRECGAEPRFQVRSCPRNCKRRARATEPLGLPGKAVTGGDPQARRPAVDSVMRRAGCLGRGRFIFQAPVYRTFGRAEWAGGLPRSKQRER